MAGTRKTLLVYAGFDILFVAAAALLVVFPLMTKQSIADTPSVRSVAQNLLLDQCPLTAAIINAIFMLLAFAASVPAFFLRRNRVMLIIQAWMIVFCALFTLGVGLAIWYSTLQTRSNLTPIWNSQNKLIQSMLQFKFQCCGYNDPSIFVQDMTCTDAANAARHGTCIGPFSVFANQFLDTIFTSMFGICALDMMLLLSVLCVLKDRAEETRYRLIDEKRGFGGI